MTDIFDCKLITHTVMFIAVDLVLVGAIAVADTVRPEAAGVVQHVCVLVRGIRHSLLQQLLSSGIDVWMVTGDNARTAKAIARQLGISNV